MTFTGNRFANFGSTSEESDSESEFSVRQEYQRKGFGVAANFTEVTVDDVDFQSVNKKGKKNPSNNSPKKDVKKESTPLQQAKKEVVVEEITTEAPVQKKKKSKGVNRFACFDNSSSDNADSDSDSEEEVMETRTRVEPIRFVQSVKESVPYYAILKIQKTVSPKTASLTKKFFPEAIAIAVTIYNSKTKKHESTFHRHIRPSEWSVLSDETINETGVTQEMIDNGTAQPLDEVMRLFDKFLKEKSLVSTLRKKKVNKLAGDLEEFIIVSDIEDMEHLKKEFLRKNFNNLGNCNLPCFKKYSNYKKIFSEYYNNDNKENLTIENMLDQVCESPLYQQNNNELDQCLNILKITKLMIADGCRLECDTQA